MVRGSQVVGERLWLRGVTLLLWNERRRRSTSFSCHKGTETLRRREVSGFRVAWSSGDAVATLRRESERRSSREQIRRRCCCLLPRKTRHPSRACDDVPCASCRPRHRHSRPSWLQQQAWAGDDAQQQLGDRFSSRDPWIPSTWSCDRLSQASSWVPWRQEQLPCSQSHRCCLTRTRHGRLSLAPRGAG